MIGVLTIYKDDRGFGFIRPSDGSKEIFIHARDAEDAGIGQLQVGMRLEFDEVLDDRNGKFRAGNLRLLSAANLRAL
jgi:CspA family cold shock protein